MITDLVGDYNTVMCRTVRAPTDTNYSTGSCVCRASHWFIKSPTSHINA
jgi:hypothetical protein